MTSPSTCDSEPAGLPIWLIVWCGWVAAWLLTPERVLRDFILGPLLKRSLAGIPEQDHEAMLSALEPTFRLMAISLALVYLLLRAITWRLRRDDER